MKRKGFTLIELLAVIVVLAIIALIATPIVMNTIKSAKKGAAERSADSYIGAVETAIATAKLDGKDIPDGTYQIDGEGNLTGTGLPNGKLEIDMKGNKPKDGTITIKDGQVTNDSEMTVGGYDVKYNDDNKKYEATEKNNSTKTYSNGEVVYFNVTTGTKCSDYTETQSNTGTNSGCMKFYAFNDDGGDTVNLILDHNTTAMVAWNNTYTNDSGSKINANGPKEVLDQLKNDTASWKGTLTPENYTLDQTGQKSNAKYTIDYSEYKARLITAQEIATITDYSGWDEKVEANSSYYYFDSKTTSASTTCKRGNTSGCQYGWLYDRTKTNCTEWGCLNNSDQTTSGYWTASSHADFSNGAWSVYYDGDVNNLNVTNSSGYGVRPVIEVLKSKLS